MSGYPSGLTVSAVELLLHYFYTPVDPDGILDVDNPACKARRELIDNGLLEQYTSDHGMYRVTVRGEVMARHIMQTPLPVQSWEMLSHNG